MQFSKAADGPKLSQADALRISIMGDQDFLAIYRLDRASLRAALSQIEFHMGRERNKAKIGHCCYDLNRHIALKQIHQLVLDTLYTH